MYPALERVPGHLFGIAVGGLSGAIYAAGDAEAEHTIMSVAKPFLFALVCQDLGRWEVRRRSASTPPACRSTRSTAIEQSEDGRTNPMVNPGAIAVDEPRPGRDRRGEVELHPRRPLAFAGRRLDVDDDVYRSASATNHRNQGSPRLLESYGAHLLRPGRGGRPLHAPELPRRDRAGPRRDGRHARRRRRNPLTHERVVEPECCHATLAVMTTAGLYETSGDWLYDIGLPGKSGIGGGIVTVAPGKGGLGTFAPLLDEAGNSVKGQLAAAFLSRRLGLDLFATEAGP